VAQKVLEQIGSLVTPVAAEVFVRMPVKPRIKSDGSFVSKAFYRNKNLHEPIGRYYR
jgi:putative GTP pyrophosphokinase